MVSNNIPDMLFLLFHLLLFNDMSSLCTKRSDAQPSYFSLKINKVEGFLRLDLGSLAYDSIKIGPNFRKQAVTKIEIIKKCCKSSCSPNTIFLT